MMEIVPLGDSALTLRLSAKPRAKPKETLYEVLGVLEKIRRADIPGVIESTSSYATVTVFFDPVVVTAQGVEASEIGNWLADQIRSVVGARGKKRAKFQSAKVTIPVCFDPEFAPDLEGVAQNTGLSTDKVIEIYCDGRYQVACIGFTPGFPYLLGLPEQLATPRHSTPRREVAAGSVGIGGKQCGIYPRVSPGGWNLIGRTSVRLFDSAKESPALLRPGDLVRFYRISRSEFDELLT